MRRRALPRFLTKLTLGEVAFVLGVGAGACESSPSRNGAFQDAGGGKPDSRKSDGGKPDGGGSDGGKSDSGAVDRADASPESGGDDASYADLTPSDAGRTNPLCDSDGGSTAAGIASAPLRISSPVRLEPTIPLQGEGLHAVLREQVNVAAGLRAEHGHTLLLTDSGFWDVSSTGDRRWYASASTMVLAARMVDLDGDGDRDVLLLTADPNDAAAVDPTASPLVTRLTAWERTSDGLMDRGEVLRVPYVILPIPYEAGDLDGDGDLDVVSYERGRPVGYLHDGAFGFTRAVLGDTTALYEDKLLTFAYPTDRNADGVLDLLVWTGEALELTVFVLLGDGAGKFGPPGPSVVVEAPLVPHGPIGTGLWIADVTGDGLVDLVTQDAQSTAEAPVLNLFVSESATRIAPATQLTGLGFEFADVDQDGKTDIVTTRNDRLLALVSQSGGTFMPRDLGVDMSLPVADFTVDPSAGGGPTLQVLYKLSACSSCPDACQGRCVFGACLACLSDADCATGRCVAHQCEP